ncbi:MAG TPA: sigma-70 family RNA polymerase sigma factor [Actinospica sp.]|nr:sigma-70 family RNA polymerase sigma factor [Actinospica sp.]
MPATRADQEYAARYAAIYQEHNAQLMSYARSLTGSATMAEDLAAEAHFRVWRRIQTGYEIENVAAYLTTTVRNLAAGLGRAQREFARDLAELPEAHTDAATAAIADPEQRASHIDLITRLLKELPDRWAKALWYAEVEDLPMEEVGAKIGASAGTTAVVLTRARERLRQAFLLSQSGTPLSEDCEPYWRHMATIVRGTASARRARNVAEHCDECADCRARMLLLTEANTRLPALLGPALLAGVLGGGAWFVPAAAGAGAGAAAGAAARAGSRGARHARHGWQAHLAKHGLSPAKLAVGSAAAVGIAATVATLALGSTDKPNTTVQAALQTPPASSLPTTAPVAQGSSAPTSASASAPAAASSAAATQAAAAVVVPADSAAPAQAAATTAARSPQAADPTTGAAQTTAAAPATSSAPTTPASAPVPSTSSVVVPSASASQVASPITVVTPSASTSGSPSPVLTPTISPSPSDSAAPTLTPTVSPDPTCTYFVYYDWCDENFTGGS